MASLVEVFLPNGWSCKVNAQDVPAYLAKGFLRQPPKKEVEEPDVEPGHVVSSVEEVKAAPETHAPQPKPVAATTPPERKRGRKV